jgi:hypothetical protein
VSPRAEHRHYLARRVIADRVDHRGPARFDFTDLVVAA